MAKRIYNLAAWWHLLSLDAPTVAVLWSWFFARAMHLHLPLFYSLLLGLATWLLYVADRILDGLRKGAGDALRERHHFHARHRSAFLAAASVSTVLLAWCVCTRMHRAALRDDLCLASLVIAYLYFVHRRTFAATTDTPGLPKELAVAAIFAAATAVPAWSRLGGTSAGLGKGQLAPAVACFAVLCWVNCVGIDKWEALQAATMRARVHATTRWGGIHLRGIVIMIALFAGIAALLAPSRGLMAVYLAAALSSGLFFLLDARSQHLSPLHLRIAADVALLTPLALFPLAR